MGDEPDDGSGPDESPPAAPDERRDDGDEYSPAADGSSPAADERPHAADQPAADDHAGGADEPADGADASVTRRQALAYAGGAGLGLGGWKALHNVFLGYGRVGGTNLYEQDLAARVGERMRAHGASVPAGPVTVRTDGDAVGVERDGDLTDVLDLAAASRADAREFDARHELPGDPATQLYEDLRTLARDSRTAVVVGEGGLDGESDASGTSASDDERAVTVECSTTGPFFERVREAEARPYTVAALRGPRFAGVDPSLIERFAGVDPSDVEALVTGLAEGFREYSSYDVERYAAGAIEDNVLLGRGDLRERMDSPEQYEALLAGENDGLFCTELVERSLEAFHALPPTAQAAPVAGAFVQDTRHKHAFTALASVVRDGGDLVVPVTFVDYTRSTTYDDLRLRRVLGEGVEAYDDRHRTTGIFWNRHPGV